MQPGANMTGYKTAIFGAAFIIAAVLTGPTAAPAQTFANYRCADGTHFIIGFYQYDSRAHLQIDGRAVTLKKRLAFSGALFRRRRDPGDHEGWHHDQARQTACDQLRAGLKKGRNLSFRPFAFDIASAAAGASMTSPCLASALTHRFGFLDGRFVIPAVTARRLADAR